MMSESIESWLRQLDAICEAQGFETAEEAQAWLQQMSEGCSIEEFFDQHSPSESHLLAILNSAEQQQSPEAALPLYERAVRVGERFFAQSIIAPDASPSSLHLYTAALAGLAACQEWTLQAEQAVLTYQKMLHADPQDQAGAFDKLFCLLVTQGRIAEAREFLESRQRTDSFFLYNKALIAILEASDAIAWNEAQADADEPIITTSAPLDAPSLDQALRANRYLPHILTHPRSMQIDSTDEPLAGSPAEALTIAQTSAHLWLGDWAALEALIRQAPRFPISHGGFEPEWQRLLHGMGGDVSQEDRLAYLQAIEEQMN
jgi:tetratricopeptide (TPR) repeat protein